METKINYVWDLLLQKGMRPGFVALIQLMGNDT
jgi:hypothetical protein